jgi:hypothetical protein
LNPAAHDPEVITTAQPTFRYSSSIDEFIGDNAFAGDPAEDRDTEAAVVTYPGI